MTELPNDRRYTSTHEWVKLDNDFLLIGITNHAQELLGDMVYVELPHIGDVINAGDEMGVVESVKAASDFYAPINGEVIEINNKVSEDPSLVNKDPYGAGWLVKIKAADTHDLDKLLNAEQYQNATQEEL
jgi:glycine cleavage system H protein